ncbi:DNA (cytosine-5-)-methyltransferase [Neisseria animalis]|uniref:DNA (cytosine-5-)-methyltransferase n=1 Tax=Neisseria animalis TaxID=492 RepID=UPI000F6B6FE2|nr:DNA (cytosine-5-)-methyltransferase [Neisseria animalis]VEE06098.1 NgoIM [Neisseria animalis]
MDKNHIKVVELFAGVGGFRLGLEAASSNYQTVWANQWEPGKKSQHAYDCYVRHFGTVNHTNENISTAKHSIPKHDFLVGGFPCQDYSVARTGAAGIEGKKGVLWWDIRDIIEANHPKWILLENVDRLLKSPSNQRGKDFGVMLRCLYDLGYTVEWRVINAAEYGHAQRRRRIFIFACKRESGIATQLFLNDPVRWLLEDGIFAKAFPVLNTISKNRQSHTSISDGLEDLKAVSDRFTADFYNAGVMIDSKVYSLETIPEPHTPTTLGSILETRAVEEHYFLNGNLEKWQYLKGAKRIPRIKPNGEPYFFAEGSMSFPDSLDLPARTMLTSESSVNRSTHVVTDKKSGQLRLLTPIECERLNGFPDDWTNTGMPQKFRYFTMGNALVVPIIQKIGEELLRR